MIGIPERRGVCAENLAAATPLPSHEDVFRQTAEKGDPFADTHTDTVFQSASPRLFMQLQGIGRRLPPALFIHHGRRASIPWNLKVNYDILTSFVSSISNILNNRRDNIMKKNILSFLCITFLACLLVSFTAFAQELPIVTIIEVKGLKRIDEAAIRAKLSQKIREPLAQEKTSEDIKSIYKMGYFDDVEVEIEPFEGGIKVIYIIREKPTIIRVDFQGNKEFDEAKLKEKVTIIPGAISDITLINDNAVKLKAFYEDEGYYLAQVVPVVRKVTEGEVAVTYQIEEGEKVKIKEIRIEGNSAISAKAIKKAMKTAERGIFSFITGTGYYKKDVMKEDVERIKDVYYNNGYLKVIVQEPKIELIDNKKGMRISIAVIEREQFTVSSVDRKKTRRSFTR